MIKKPELLAPAGNKEMLNTAIKSGADAVYIGIKGINMRANARNFEIKDLKPIVKLCHENNVKIYLALNTIVHEDELKKVKKIIEKAKGAGIDAIIAWDLSVISYAKELKLKVHLSTQASSSNSDSITLYEKLGIKRVVLARECSLDEIKKIRKKTKVEIETFIHGAMCVAVSGRCFMSHFLYKRSANKGDCIQPCRRSYIIKDPETDEELMVENNHILSPKDLCTIEMIDKMIDAGIDSFKIEGRNRSAEYVKHVVETYREAIDLHFENKLTKKKKVELKEKLSNVYNRDFSTGFYLGKPMDEWCDVYGSKSKMTKKSLGIVKNYYPKAKAAEIKLEGNKLNTGDTILIIGSTTGCVEMKVDSMEINGRKVENVKKGLSVGIKVAEKVRKNDMAYLWVER